MPSLVQPYSVCSAWLTPAGGSDAKRSNERLANGIALKGCGLRVAALFDPWPPHVGQEQVLILDGAYDVHVLDIPVVPLHNSTL